MQTLKAAGFGQRPRTNAGRVEEGEASIFSEHCTFFVQRHEVGCFIIEQDRQAQVDMEQSNQAVEGKMVLRRNHDACVVEPFNGLLSVEFGRVEHHHRSVRVRFAQRIEQPWRTTFARRDVFRCDGRCSLHENQPVHKNTAEPISTCGGHSFQSQPILHRGVDIGSAR